MICTSSAASPFIRKFITIYFWTEMEKRKPSMGSNEYMPFIMKVKGKLKESRERKQKTLLKHLNSLKSMLLSQLVYI